MDKNTFTLPYDRWEKVAEKLRTSWPEVLWPTGSIQNSARCLAAEIQDHLNASVVEHKGFTIRIDDDDWDSKAALWIAGA